MRRAARFVSWWLPKGPSSFTPPTPAPPAPSDFDLWWPGLGAMTGIRWPGTPPVVIDWPGIP